MLMWRSRPVRRGHRPTLLTGERDRWLLRPWWGRSAQGVEAQAGSEDEVEEI